MHQSRHYAIGIEFAISRVVLIAAQRQQVLPDLETFFVERDTNLLRAYRIDVVIVLEHDALPT